MTPCPDLDRLVDAALAGLPGAAERLAAHADACTACLAEADLLDDADCPPVAELALLAEASCPPDVLAAALAEVSRSGAPRRAADRDALRPDARPARPVWTRRVAVGVALAAVLFALRGIWPDAPSDPPPVATSGSPAVQGVPSGPDLATTTVRPSPAPARTPTPDTRAARLPAARTGRPAPVRPVPTLPAPAPIDTTDAAPDAPVGTALDEDLTSLTPADSAAARQDLLLALAIVGRAQRTADDAVSAEMRRVADALEPARTL